MLTLLENVRIPLIRILPWVSNARSTCAEKDSLAYALYRVAPARMIMG